MKRALFMVGMFFLLTGIAYAQEDAAAAATTVTINMTWNAGQNVADYRVMQSVNGGAFAQLAIVPAATLTYAASGLAKGPTYIHRVIPRDALGVEGNPYPDCTISTTGATPGSTLTCTATAQ